MNEHKIFLPTETFPICKINIGLYVTRKREDGYHDLETVFYPLPLHDNLSIAPLKMSDAPYRLQVAGRSIEADAADNLIVKVYEQLRADFPLPPLDIYLYKRIPMGAGLGGGSSDAAAMMRLLNDTFALGLTTEEMERRVARLGADCAFFIKGDPAFATGIGDLLSPISLSLKGYVLVLVKPDIFVSTREAYGGITPTNRDTIYCKVFGSGNQPFLLKSFNHPFSKFSHQKRILSITFYYTYPTRILCNIQNRRINISIT